MIKSFMLKLWKMALKIDDKAIKILNKIMTTKLIMFFVLASINLFSQINLTDTTDRIAEYTGGTQKVHAVIRANLIYPVSAQKDNISGKCYIKFTVDTFGHPINVIVQKSLRNDCDTAAMRAVKHLIEWAPGKLKGRKVPVTMTIPINFSPNEK